MEENTASTGQTIKTYSLIIYYSKREAEIFVALQELILKSKLNCFAYSDLHLVMQINAKSEEECLDMLTQIGIEEYDIVFFEELKMIINQSQFLTYSLN